MAFVQRHARELVLQALDDSRAVALLGARQVGKSTLTRDLVKNEYHAELVDLDDEVTRQSALEDPTGYLATIGSPAVIDEIQRAPDLLLAIKSRLDRNQARGQFLLTGSANILTLPIIQDALPGRVEYVHLWPLSQGEISGKREQFLSMLFEGDFPRITSAPFGRKEYASIIVAGGFPDVHNRSDLSRARFFASYTSSLLGREVSDLTNVRNIENVEQLLRIIASRSANLVNYRGMSGDLGVEHKTVKAHTKVLEDLFLVREIPAWHKNLGSRVISAPKVYVTDSGLLSYLLRVNPDRFDDGIVAGIMFETFAAMEILRQADWHEWPLDLFHYRDKEKREVDILVESYHGDIIAIEIKSTASVNRKDFANLRYLRDRLGNSFKAGAVLYTGEKTLPFGDRLAAVPLIGLWS